MFYINFILIFLLSLTIRITHQSTFFEQHIPKEIDDHNLAKISNTITNIEQLNNIINRMLIPRVVGTEGHELVKNFIIQSMEQLQWTVETDVFQENTPIFGVLTFTNIIATINPNADEFLLMACHYDSKYFPNEEFLGATDSAVPCSMMISIAMTLEKYLKQIVNNQNTISIGLKFVFFDGEEAFLQWSATDSIYGARHLAAKWESEGFLPKIHMLMLLDLLGAPDPNFYSFFKSTENWYVRFCVIEERLSNAGLMDKYTSSSAAVSVRSTNSYFQTSSSNSYIEDDHIPFLQRGVPILHLIPTPFPKVWHKMTDDRQAIDIDTVENLNRILRIFIIEYFHIEV